MLLLLTAVLAAGGGAAATFVVGRLSVTVAAALALFVLSVFWLVESRRHRSAHTAPYVILSVGMILVGLGGYLVYSRIADRGPVPELFYFDPRDRTAMTTLLGFAVAAVVPAAFARFSPSRNYARHTPPAVRRGREAPAATEHVSWLLVTGAVVVPIVWLAGCDIPSLLERATYQGFYGSYVVLYRIGNGLDLGATALALFLLTGRPTPVQRFLLWTAVGLSAFLAIGTTSRQAALLPLIAFAVWVIRRRPTTASAVVVGSLSALASLVLLQAMLMLRNGAPHGWLPYLARTVVDPATYLVPDLPRHVANVLSGFAKADFLLREVSVDKAYLLAQLDPRPGLGTNPGGTGLADGFILPYIPFNTLGTLAVSGVLAVAAFTLVTCAVFWISISIAGAARQPFYRNSGIALLSGAALLIALFYAHYPVRSTVRVLTYLPVLSIGIIVIERVSVQTRRVWRREHPRPASVAHDGRRREDGRVAVARGR